MGHQRDADIFALIKNTINELRKHGKFDYCGFCVHDIINKCINEAYIFGREDERGSAKKAINKSLKKQIEEDKI